MSKIPLLNQIKAFVLSHLVPVIATSAVVVVGATAGIVAIVVNTQGKDTEIAVNSPSDSPREEEQTKPNEESDKEKQNQESASEEKPSTSSTPNVSEQAKPTTSQNQTSNNPNATTQKPNTSSNQSQNTSSSSTSTTTPSKPNTSQTQPSQPTNPTTPTQPTTPVEPEKPTVKTDYYYLCVGTTDNPELKAEILSWGGNIGQDFMAYSFERKAPITNCLDEIRKMNVPDIAHKLSWKLYEFDAFDELMRFTDNLFYGSN